MSNEEITGVGTATLATRCINNLPEVLLLYRPEVKLWELAGGKVKKGETLQMAAERELAEEAKLFAPSRNFRQVSSLMHPGRAGTDWWETVFFVACGFSTQKVVISSEHSKASWFFVVHLPKNIWNPSRLGILEALRKGMI